MIFESETHKLELEYPRMSNFDILHSKQFEPLDRTGSFSAPVQGYYGRVGFDVASSQKSTLPVGSTPEQIAAKQIPRNVSITTLALEEAVGNSLAYAINSLDLNGQIRRTPRPLSRDTNNETVGQDFLPHLAFNTTGSTAGKYLPPRKQYQLDRHESFPSYSNYQFYFSHGFPLSAPPHPMHSRSSPHQDIQPKIFDDIRSPHLLDGDKWSTSFKSMAGSEIMPFLTERENHALVLCNVERISLSKLSAACQAYGAIYYLRTEYRARGIVFLAYLNQRAAVCAFEGLPRELRALGATSAATQFSISLHAASLYHDSKIILCNISKVVNETDIAKICRTYGEIRGIRVLSANTDELLFSVLVEYFDVSDAQLAVQELDLHRPHSWGRKFVVETARRSEEERVLGRQLLAILDRWHNETSHQDCYESLSSKSQKENPLFWSSYSTRSASSDSDNSFESSGLTIAEATTGSIPSATVKFDGQIHRESKTGPSFQISDVRVHPAGVPLSVGAVAEDAFSLDINKIANALDKRTTIMIRNIPNKYTQMMLLNEVDTNYRGTYDFFYLPIDFKNRCNVGYAFVNFIDYRQIIPFTREFHGQRWRNFNSEKVCAISYARIQGKLSMISRFQNSSLMEKDFEYRPLLFYSSGPEKGNPEPFPAGNKQRRSSCSPPNDSNDSECNINTASCVN